jgi:2-polyprenyl-6-methoxyphenol hydroxylase-like FAD-dependent oxidoreductase
MFDVIIVGWGPTGMVASCLLGRAGYRVGVFERYPATYKLPRVGAVHDDVFRVFQEIGITEKILPAIEAGTQYEMVHDETVLFRTPLSAEAAHGWPQFISIFQPYFEAELESVAKQMPNVDVLQGHRVVSVSQTASQVEVEIEDIQSGEIRHERGRYLIAADGGKSFVRGYLGIETEFLGFEQDWLVVDAEKRRERAGWPENRMVCNPEAPAAVMRMGKYHRRWAFKIEKGLSLDDAVESESVWKRLNRTDGATPEEVNLIRHVAYRFTAQLARNWRVHRIFLAGDAAHQMPPYLGQGMCSGIRDAQNLSSKLDHVMRGLANEDFLDLYAVERKANCREAILESIRVGRMVIEDDPDRVRDRDVALQAAQKTSTQQLVGYRIPGLKSGFIAGRGNSRGSGEVFVQGQVVDQNGLQGRFDDVIGRGYLILTRKGDPGKALSIEHMIYWRSLGGRIYTFGEASSQQADGHFIDSGRWYANLLDEFHSNVIIKRSDYYIFGMYQSVDDLPAALADVRGQLTAKSSAEMLAGMGHL